MHGQGGGQLQPGDPQRPEAPRAERDGDEAGEDREVDQHHALLDTRVALASGETTSTVARVPARQVSATIRSSVPPRHKA